MPVAKELDAMTDRELYEKRQCELSSQVSTRASTYEIVCGRAANAPTEVVTDLPPAERGELLFYQGGFWLVDAIEPARSRKADGRLKSVADRDVVELIFERLSRSDARETTGEAQYRWVISEAAEKVWWTGPEWPGLEQGVG